jgi:hypothetical protein
MLLLLLLRTIFNDGKGVVVPPVFFFFWKLNWPEHVHVNSCPLDVSYFLYTLNEHIYLSCLSL